MPEDAEVAARKIPLGTAVNDQGLHDPLYRRTLDANFNAVTPENEMKWETTEPERGVFNFGPADEIVNYALAHGMTVHGHNLVWNQHPLALEWTHEADPHALLFINDYNIDWPGPKEQAMLALAQKLHRMGVPLGAVGMEEHLSLAWAPSPEQLSQAMESYARLGLKVEVTGRSRRASASRCGVSRTPSPG